MNFDNNIFGSLFSAKCDRKVAESGESEKIKYNIERTVSQLLLIADDRVIEACRANRSRWFSWKRVIKCGKLMDALFTQDNWLFVRLRYPLIRANIAYGDLR